MTGPTSAAPAPADRLAPDAGTSGLPAIASQTLPDRGDKPSTRHLGKRPALDGLRGLAWLTVFVGHAGLLHVPGVARIAMFLFFGLSGFLITALLVAERERRDSVSLRRFFARRALRLGPGLLVFLSCWLLIVALLGAHRWMNTVPGDNLGGAQSLSAGIKGALASLGYVANWFDIRHGMWGHLALGHLWSLAVEEQFYLVWAPVLAILFVFVRPRTMVFACVAAASASVLEAIWLEESGRQNWSYMGTDSRAGCFLIGAAFALAWSYGRLNWLEHRGIGQLAIAGSLLSLVFCARPLATNPSATIFASMWVLATIAAPLLVVSVILQPASALSLLLSKSVATYIGRRSYGLYLWHYVFLTWFHDLGLAGVAVALGATLLVAELSWRVVEAPALRLKRRLASS